MPEFTPDTDLNKESNPLPNIPVPEVGSRVSGEEIVRINRALEITKGNMTAAAKLLGVPITRVKDAVKNIPALEIWKRDEIAVTTTPVESSIEVEVNRVLPPEIALSPSEKRAQALVVTERNLNKSLSRLGFKSTEIEAISSVDEFAGQHFEQTLSIMHGGMLKSAMRLMLLVERIEQTYLQDESLDEKDKRWWWDIYFRILENLRLMNDQTNKAALTKAMIEIKKKESRENKLGKPGFTPIQINVSTDRKPQ
jgi:hypothetical protein